MSARSELQATVEALVQQGKGILAADESGPTIVPIVEPEVLIDGDHSMARCAEVTEAVLHEVFHALHSHRVVLDHMLLKPGLVLPGKAHAQQARPAEVAAQTIRILRRTVPRRLLVLNCVS